jgi:hypothetical protein
MGLHGLLRGPPQPVTGQLSFYFNRFWNSVRGHDVAAATALLTGDLYCDVT